MPISSSAFDNDHLRPAARNAGARIPDGHRFGLHNLRHSLSNWLVNKAKENPKTVQAILGHSRIQTTLDLCSDSDLDAMIEAQELEPPLGTAQPLQTRVKATFQWIEEWIGEGVWSASRVTAWSDLTKLLPYWQPRKNP